MEAESLLAAIEAALEKDVHLLNKNEIKNIREKMMALEASCNKASSDAIMTSTEILNAATEDFAAKRMDASVSRALAGKNLDELKL